MRNLPERVNQPVADLRGRRGLASVALLSAAERPPVGAAVALQEGEDAPGALIRLDRREMIGVAGQDFEF